MEYFYKIKETKKYTERYNIKNSLINNNDFEDNYNFSNLFDVFSNIKHNSIFDIFDIMNQENKELFSNTINNHKLLLPHNNTNINNNIIKTEENIESNRHNKYNDNEIYDS